METDQPPKWIEATVVDGDLPMEYRAEHSEFVSVFAQSEAHARLAVRLFFSDGYEVVDFSGSHEVNEEIDDVTEFVETNEGTYETQINAYEVFDEASFRVSFYDGEEWQRHRAGSLRAARDWFDEQETGDRGPSYDGGTSVGPQRGQSQLPATYVSDYLADE